MHFNSSFMRYVRLLLLPLSLPVYVYIQVRHLCYALGWKKSTRFGLPVICIGNLSVGGTGKSPMTEYILELLLPHLQTAVLSRGYGRSTRGYLLAQPGDTAEQIGDEPRQILHKFPATTVAVGERRVPALRQLLHDHPHTQAVVLDDAFQHRAIAAGFNILLTTWDQPYWKDYVLPAGNLRDARSSARRANIIVVTKCPPQLDTSQKQSCYLQAGVRPGQRLFFASLSYGHPYHIFSGQKHPLQLPEPGLLVTGIANPRPLLQYLHSPPGQWVHMAYADHHPYTTKDVALIIENFEKLPQKEKIILTTEKDAMRLHALFKAKETLPIYAIPVAHTILFDEETIFRQGIWDFINTFSTNSPTDNG